MDLKESQGEKDNNEILKKWAPRSSKKCGSIIFVLSSLF